MSFWTTEKMWQRFEAENLIEPYSRDHVKNCSYELMMGEEAFITSTDDKCKKKLGPGESLVIPSGQLAFLLTEEKVEVPLDALGLISMRFSFKKKGLINVSGFHVDPGYRGRLKFAVYNAGSSEITITRGDRIFVIWYSDLVGTDSQARTATAHGYGGEKTEHNTITSTDQNNLHGEIASPAQLKAKLGDVENFYKNNLWVLGVAVTLLGALCVKYIFYDGSSNKGDLSPESLKLLIRSEVEAANAVHQSKPKVFGNELGAMNTSFTLACFKKDLNALTNYYNDNSELLHSKKGRSKNRAEIIKFWNTQLSGEATSIELFSDRIDADNIHCIESGSYNLKGSSNKDIEIGRYLVVWKKTDGVWKRHSETWNAE